MANTVISLRSSGVTGNTPSLGVLANGELSLNFADGILYYKSAANTLGSIQTTQPTGLNQEIQFNDSGSFGANSAFTFNKTTGLLSTNNLTANSVATTSYIQFGDGSKQYTANAGAGGGGVTSVAGATGVVSNTQILSGLLTVDGTGSGLDADLLDGLNSSSFANSTFAQAAFDKANQTSQLAFTTVSANGTSVVADANNDTLTLTAENGIGIFANATTDTITINLTPTGVTSGTYANATHVPVITTDAYGRVSSITNTAISFPSSTDTLQTVTTRGSTTANAINVTNTTVSTSNITGALIVGGGVGVKGNVYADAVYDGGIEVIAFANQAFTQANSANVLAQASFNFANTANIKVDSAYAFANTVNIKVDSAYAFANVANTIAQASFNFANTANIKVDSAYAFANTVNIKVDSAFAFANIANIKVDAAFTKANAANVLAQASFDKANTSNTTADAAFAKANSANVIAQAAFDNSNTKFNSSGGSISGDVSVTGNLTIIGQTIYANTTTALIADNIITLNAAINQASAPTVDAGIEVDRGSSANVSILWNETTDKWTFTNDGSTYFNIADAGRLDSSFTHANGAFDKANTATTTVGLSYNHANGAFDKANTATTTAQNAYNTANTASTVASGAYTHANGAFDKANTATTTAGLAYTHANGAFDKANTATTTAQNAYNLANGTAGIANTDYTTLTASAGTYGNASHVPVTTLTANGRVSSITNTAIAIDTAAITSGTLSVARGGTGVTTSTGTGAVTLNTSPTLVNVSVSSVNVTNTTVSTSNSTGAITVSGGIGVRGNVYADAIYDGGIEVIAFANQAFTQANSANILAQASFNFANTANIKVDSAYAFANTVNIKTDAAFVQANAANVLAQAAFNKANQSAQLAFTTVAANGINVVADANNDTLTLSAANGVGITADASSDTITINLTPTGVTSGTYGGATQIPTFVVDTQGRLTSASNVAISTTLNIAADTGLNAVALSTDTLTFVGGDGITSSIGSTDNVRFDVDNTVIRTTGNQTITGNLSVTGNLIVIGNTVIENVTSLSLNDPLLQLAANNEISDAIDIGFYGHFSDDGGVSKRHAGLFRDTSTSDKRFILFTNLIDSGLDNAVALTVNTAQTSFATANLQTNIIGGRVSGLTQAIAIADGGTNATSFNTGNLIFFNGTSFAAIANTGTAGTYANASHVPVITTDAYGRVSGITNTSISIATSQITSGTLPIARGGTNQTTYTTGAALQFDGTSISTLANTGTAGTYANASHVPVITTDAYGRVSAVTNTAIVLAASAITSGTLPVARGGTNQTTYTNGIIAFNGTSLATLANTGTAATYANASHIPVITTDAYGRVSSITNTAVAIDASAITSGTLSVARGGTGVTTSTGTGSVVLNTSPTFSGTITTGTGVGGIITGANVIYSNVFVANTNGWTSANVGTAGTYGNSTYVPIITTDAYGRVSSITTSPITGGGGTQNVTIATFNTTANGTTLTYDLGFNPAAANAIFVTIDGVVQPESTYTVNTTANTITFGVEPAATENVRVVAFTPTIPFFFEDGSIDPSKLSVSTNNFIVATALDAAVALAIALG